MPEQPSVSILSFSETREFRHEVVEEQEKPILLVDVDGVLSLWGFDADNRPDGSFQAVDGTPHFLSAEAGRHLLRLSEAFALVWCTGWEEKANEYLPHHYGLPGPLPFLSFDRHAEAGTTTPGHWKLGAIDAYARERPLAWIDDAFNDACHAWAAQRPAPTLLVPTEPARGLTSEHAALLTAWASSTASAASPSPSRAESST
jgi:HAD domain in Swiss Army Knife RNA repair proteins